MNFISFRTPLIRLTRCTAGKGSDREGMTDLELAAELEMTARKGGHQGFLRMRAFNAELFYAHIFREAIRRACLRRYTPRGNGVSTAFAREQL